MATGHIALLDGLLVTLTIGVITLLFQKRIREAPFWRATVTPLASIIGSGFLVVVPLLASAVGEAAVPAVIAVMVVALWAGSAIRFSIRATTKPTPGEARIDRISEIVLLVAFVISITFYVRIMAGFVLEGTRIYSALRADVLATVILAGIGLYGWLRGLHGLERIEQYAVTIKLAIIVSLLAGLAFFDATSGYDLSELSPNTEGPWATAATLGGMLIIAQGFETSKYLPTTYSPLVRARSMLVAQLLAGGIYVAFVALALPLIPLLDGSVSETAIIGLSGNVAYILPLMLVVAAVMSQLSAAVADTIGAGGVVEEESHKRVPASTSYPLIAALSIALLWAMNIFEIITLASRAFAAFYMFQAARATIQAWHLPIGWRRWRAMLSYSTLCLLMFGIVVFARPIGT